MPALVSALFFLSGASALAFETLWFHQARLALGSSVMAGGLVLAAFMAGLALGNAIAARRGDRIARPLRVFAGLEAIVGATGVALVFGLPGLGPALAPLLGPLETSALSLGGVRFLLAFALLVIPTGAMGLTLPVLSRALAGGGLAYGPALGRLYGWNTLGALAGVALAEGLCIEAWGIRATALAAAGGNALAALGALALATRSGEMPVTREVSTSGSGALPWRIAAFLLGFALLALEVVVFRFLALFVVTRAEAFAAMLGVALLGIGVGGLLGEASLARGRRSWRFAGAAALLCGAAVAGGYAVFPAWSASLGATKVSGAWEVVRLCLPLLLPASLLSGLLFPWLGAALRESRPGPARTTGELTVANTLGAAAGSLTATFVLLPRLGMEASWVVLALLYVGVGGGLARAVGSRDGPDARAPLLAAGVACVAAGLLFPFGAMREVHVPRALEAYDLPESARLHVREGVNETLLWVETPFLGVPYVQRLVTNSFSMSATDVQARRYMKLYVYLPAAIHPGLRDTLLLSYGVGSTARALADTQGVERIDVVDVSRDILELSERAFPDPERDPLRDPRVTVHVEDGRQFLAATPRRYDLVTGEPPPPVVSGVVSLYTREYFARVRDRLAEGGMFTTWLPLRQLSDASALSIVRAFCDVFPDCSLWRGMSFDLMLLGTRDAGGPVSAEHFRAQWRQPVVARELAALGFERPGQLGALFIADAEQLETWIADVPPLVDDRPRRISAAPTSQEAMGRLFSAWLDPRTCRARFSRSAFIDRHWPEELRAAALPFFDLQHLLDTFGPDIRSDLWSERLTDLRAVLSRSALETPVLWLLGSDADLQRIVREAGDAALESPEAALQRAAGAVAKRDFDTALRWLERAEAAPETFDRAAPLDLFLRCHLGRHGEAQARALELAPRLPEGRITDDLLDFLARECGIHAR